jgi:DNA-binding transcriptional regulator YiaG
MNNTIAMKHNSALQEHRMITGAQIRAARALLGWTSQRLADASSVHYATISRAEQADGVPSIRATTLGQIESTLISAGVMFLDPGDTRSGGHGVRLR